MTNEKMIRRPCITSNEKKDAREEYSFAVYEMMDTLAPEAIFGCKTQMRVNRFTANIGDQFTQELIRRIEYAIDRSHPYKDELFVSPDRNIMLHPCYLSYLFSLVITINEHKHVSMFDLVFNKTRDMLLCGDIDLYIYLTKCFSWSIEKELDGKLSWLKSDRYIDGIIEICKISKKILSTGQAFLDASIDQTNHGYEIGTGFADVIDFVMGLIYATYRTDPSALYATIDAYYAKTVMCYIDCIVKSDASKGHDVNSFTNVYQVCQKVYDDSSAKRDAMIHSDIESMLDWAYDNPSEIKFFYGFGIQSDGTCPYTYYDIMCQSIDSGENVYPNFEKGVH